MFESPQIDMGYDISNYEAIHEPYGTVKDMEALIKECYQRGIRLLLDLVVNHTSKSRGPLNPVQSAIDTFGASPVPRLPVSASRQPTGGVTSPARRGRSTRRRASTICICLQRNSLISNGRVTHVGMPFMIVRGGFGLEKGVDGFRIDTVNMYSKCPVSELRDASVEDKDVFEQPAWTLYAKGPRSELHCP